MSQSGKTRQSFLRNSRQQGQALVEFVLTATFLVLLTVAVLEVADFIYTYSVLADAANEGLRYAIVHGVSNGSPDGPGTGGTASSPPCTSTNATTNSAKTGASVTGTTNAVNNFAAFSLHNISSSGSNATNVYVCYLDGNNKLGSQVEVTVSYPYQPFFFKWPTVTVYANSAGRIVF